MPDGPAGDRVTCPSCGYRTPYTRGSGFFIDIARDAELRFPSVGHVMGDDPLVVTCANCASPLEPLDWFCVFDRHDPFACTYVTSSSGPPELDLPAEHCLVTGDLATAQDAVNEHLRRIADDVRRSCLALITYGDTAGVDVETALTKTRLAIATLFVPGVPEALEIFDDYICGVAPWYVLDAFRKRIEPAGALDAALPYWGIYEGARGRLAAVAGDRDAPPAQALASAFVLAWFADRSEIALDSQTQATWIARLIASLELSQGSPIALDEGFLRRTIPEHAAWAFLVAGVEDQERFRHRVAAAKQAGLLPTTDPVRFLQFEGTAEQRRERIVAFAGALTLDETSTAIELLARYTLVDEAEALIRPRLAWLAASPSGPSAVARVMRLFSDAAQPARALELFVEFWQSGGGERLSADATILLFREQGIALRLSGLVEQALESFEVARTRLADSDRPEAQEELLSRQMAVSYRDLGVMSKAKRWARRGLELAESAEGRADLLETLASCLMHDGEFEAAAAALEDATGPRDEIIHSNPRMMAGVLQQRAEVQALLGREAAAFESACDAAELAASLNDGSHQATFVWASATSLMASVARRLGRRDTDTIVAEADQATQRGLEASAAAPAWRPSSLVARARLLAARDDVAALKELSDAAPNLGLHRLLAQAHFEHERWAPARAEFQQTWDHLLLSVERQLQGDADPVDALRIAHEVQWWAGALALRDLRAGELTARQAVAAAELRSSVIAGLQSWPPEERPNARALVQDGEALVASLGDRVLVVTVLAGRNEVALLCAGPGGDRCLGVWPASALSDLRAELAQATRRARPRADPLASAPLWQRFSESIGEALAPVLAGASHAVLATATSLAGVPLHMVAVGGQLLCLRLACTYVPGLLGFAGLRRFPRERPGFERVGVVSVARGLDLAAAKQAFAAGADRAEAIAARHGAAVTALRATAATPEAVRGLFGAVDLAYLSCHGLARPGDGSHALLLAADDQLPPMLVGASEGARGTRHLLDWDAIEAPTPAVVLSAACSSGSATISLAGERLGLDRAFLRAGTRLFLGPLWDVAIDDAHALADGLLDAGLRRPGDWASAWRDVLADAVGSVAPSAWSSFALIGDSRP